MNARRALPLHDRVDRVQRRADDVARGLVDAAPRRRIAGIEIAVAARRALAHEIDVGRRVKALELVARRGARDCRAGRVRRARSACNSRMNASCRSGPNGWPSPKAVARDLVAGDQEHGWQSRFASRRALGVGSELAGFGSFAKPCSDSLSTGAFLYHSRPFAFAASPTVSCEWPNSSTP